MTDFGTEKTISILNGNPIADVVKYHEGAATRSMRNYRIKIKVINAQDEMSEFIRFTSELSKLREQGKLTVDKDDATTFPAFIIQYPKESFEGSYFIIKCYTVII